MRDVRDELTAEHHALAKAKPEKHPDAPVHIRLARAQDAEELAACFYRAYGDSYDHDWVYRPDEIRQRWRDRVTVSLVGIAPEGEVIGHLAADFDRPDATVAESGQAVVDPRYRGHHLFESMKRWLAQWASGDGLYGLFSEATAAHPYSQRGNLTLGAHEMGYLIGYIPSSVHNDATTDRTSAHRATAALMYLRTNAEPERAVHVPESYRDIAMRVYDESGLQRVAGRGEGSSSAPGTVVHLGRDLSHNAAQLHCKTVGSDVHERVAQQLEALKADGVDCVYLDLPLADPDVFVHGAELDGLGFSFSCILPEIRADGDVLRLQHLNGVDPHVEEIATASDFGRALMIEIAASLDA
ncbi:MAG: GNAT family N-acetyltransferase [Chloroflexota bacterium]